MHILNENFRFALPQKESSLFGDPVARRTNKYACATVLSFRPGCTIFEKLLP